MSDNDSRPEAQPGADQANPEVGQQKAADQDGEIAELRLQLNAKEEEAKNNYDRYVRQVAELDNFKKRAAREREESSRFANENLVRDLLPVIDNLERAIAHGSSGANGKPLVEGIDMVLKGFLDALSKYGVQSVAAVGMAFDPAQHEALAQVESTEHPPNTVIEQHQKGYLMRDRLLRPALVTVSKAAISQEKKNEGTEVENDQVDD
ncbi:MAG TPA: nucleotide exchange factor GrpE [Candidatus Binatia bacterium]|nr:nucleotide exchange factor GrpE [Candidatus Binatia bacterium]